MQSDCDLAVQRDGTAEIVDFIGLVRSQIFEQLDKRGRFQICPVLRAPADCSGPGNWDGPSLCCMP